MDLSQCSFYYLCVHNKLSNNYTFLFLGHLMNRVPSYHLSMILLANSDTVYIVYLLYIHTIPTDHQSLHCSNSQLVVPAEWIQSAKMTLNKGKSRNKLPIALSHYNWLYWHYLWHVMVTQAQKDKDKDYTVILCKMFIEITILRFGENEVNVKKNWKEEYKFKNKIDIYKIDINKIVHRKKIEKKNKWNF